MQRVELVQHYSSNFDSNVFLETYLTDRLEIEPFFCSNLFKVFDQGKVKGARCVDIGGGPMVHRLAYASRFCDQLVHTDILKQNLDLVRQWLTTNDLDHKHRHLMKFAAQQEGYENELDGARAIEERLRSKLVSILPIDVLNEEPIEDLDRHGGFFDCAISHACVQAACRTFEESVQAVKNIGRILKPGGALVFEGFLNSGYYKVGSATFPFENWNSEIVEKILKEAGFQLETIKLEKSHIFFGNDKIPLDMYFSLSYKN